MEGEEEKISPRNFLLEVYFDFKKNKGGKVRYQGRAFETKG